MSRIALKYLALRKSIVEKEYWCENLVISKRHIKLVGIYLETPLHTFMYQPPAVARRGSHESENYFLPNRHDIKKSRSIIAIRIS
ncbi:277_t:CDS:2, partial [Cetraspora pellucida]